MNLSNVFASVGALVISSALVCGPASAAPGGHGGSHVGKSTEKASGKTGRAGHYGVRSRSSYHAKSGFKSTHSSRYTSSRGLRPVATSEHLVGGYYRRDGHFVQPYHATNADGTLNNNYSTRGNINPYTGVAGTKPRDGE